MNDPDDRLATDGSSEAAAPAKALRDSRLAAALRANLRRRKARRSDAPGPDETGKAKI